MSDLTRLTHDEVDELAALYVLDALEADECNAIRQHLATCGQPHPIFAQLAAVTPALAVLTEPIDAPAELRSRVLSAVSLASREPMRGRGPGPQQEPMGAFGPAAVPAPMPSRGQAAPPPGGYRPASIPGGTVRPQGPVLPPGAPPQGPRQLPGQPVSMQPAPQQAPYPAPIPIGAARERRASRSLGWIGLAAAAGIAIVALAIWNVLLQQRTNELDSRNAFLRTAVATCSDPAANAAQLTSEAAPQVTGCAAFPAGGEGFVVVSGLPPAPSDQTYQLWYLVGDQAPSPANLMTVGSDGLGILQDLTPLPGTTAVAFTLEPSGGSQSPTLPIRASGALAAPTAVLLPGVY
jgi:anti-sigma-K factor RskA